MKFLSLIRARAIPAAELCRWILDDFAPQLSRHGIRCAISVLSEPAPNIADVVLETWTADPGDIDHVHAPELLQRAEIATYQIAESIEKDELQCSGSPTPAVKLIAAWEAREDVARTEVRRHWDEHVPLANRIHVGCERYVRNWVEALVFSSACYPRPYQGFAFQYFRTHRDLVERSFDKPESQAVIDADVGEFLSRFDVLLTTEYVRERAAGGV